MDHNQDVRNLVTAVEAGAARVLAQYQAFHQLFETRNMSELGLTDQFMMGAKAAAVNTMVVDWVKGENASGADFKIVSGGVPYFFQAKIAKRAGTRLSADFLYESTSGHVYNYQNVLLADHAASMNGRAYYVIYDYEGVYWLNATALKKYLSDDPAPTVQGAWQLIRTNFVDVS